MKWNPGDVIAALAFLFTLIGVIVGAAWKLSEKLGKLETAISVKVSDSIEKHQIGCANYEPNTSPRIRALGGNARPEDQA